MPKRNTSGRVIASWPGERICSARGCDEPASDDIHNALCDDHRQQAHEYRQQNAMVILRGHHKGRGWVYFARCGDLIKVGWSRDPVTRVNTLGGELLWVQPGTRLDEQRVHAAFAHLNTPQPDRLASSEYFRAAPALIDFIADLQGN